MKKIFLLSKLIILNSRIHAGIPVPGYIGKSGLLQQIKFMSTIGALLLQHPKLTIALLKFP